MNSCHDYHDIWCVTVYQSWVSSQIINLTQLAPDIQEAILDLDPTTDHVPRFREREVRTIAILPNWEKQRVLWKRLVKPTV